MKKSVVFTSMSLAALLVSGGIAFTWAQDTNQSTQSKATVTQSPVQSPGQSKQVTIWRDPNCGCCDAYAVYLEENAYEVTRVDDSDFYQRSVDAGVPERGLGCHLAEIDGYYVSGLVPTDIIERLITERPDITGITLPGMQVMPPVWRQKKQAP